MIFWAIKQMAVRWELFCPRCSNSIRTVRSRTFAEFVFGLPVASSSHQTEPPGIPGRFRIVST